MTNQKFYTNLRLYGNTILHRYIEVENGISRYVVTKESNFMPTVYTTSKKDTGWTNLYGVKVMPKVMDSIRDAKDWIKTYDDVDGIEIHGNNDFLAEYIAREYPGKIQFDINRIRIFFFDIEVTVGDGFPDPMKAEQPITAITIYDSTTKIFHAFGVKELDKKIREDVVYYNCGTEKKLITSVISFWKSNYPDIVTGWNINGFDVPYVINRASKLFGEEYVKTLSPWNKIDAKSKNDMFGQSTIDYDIWGIEVLDYLELYKKYVPKGQESYTLEYICQQELKVGKLEYEGTLNELYENDYFTYMLYNVIDVERVVQLNDKLKMIELQCNLAYRAKLNYSDAFGPVKLWTSIVYHSLLEENKVYPPSRRNRKDESFEGAFVIPPKVGMHDWVVTIDATALYPSMIMSFNISPETIVQHIAELPEILHEYYQQNLVQKIVNNEIPQEVFDTLKEQGLSMTASGQFYRNEKHGLLPRLVESMFADRRTTKKKMLELKSKKESGTFTDIDKKSMDNEIGGLSIAEQGIKTCLNALYGACGNEYFPLFDVRNAESITLSGQASLLYVSKNVSTWLSTIDKNDENHVIAGDTDSMFLDLSGVAKAITNKMGEQTNDRMIDLLAKYADNQLATTTTGFCKKMGDNLNMYSMRLDFKREKIIHRMAYVAKKRYICMVGDSEGVKYKVPELSVTGLESKRSSTPKLVRNWLEEAYKIILTEDQAGIRKFVKSAETQFNAAKIEEISFPRGVNGVNKYNAGVDTKGKKIISNDVYKKGCPEHVRASLMYNYMIIKNNLQGKYPLIKEADKIKFIKLVEQNPTRENVIAFKETWPKELGLDIYVDKKSQFMKSFQDPLVAVLDKIGWSLEDRAGDHSFF
jgi:DNA polymerase elongation subunit (family B)